MEKIELEVRSEEMPAPGVWASTKLPYLGNVRPKFWFLMQVHAANRHSMVNRRRLECQT